MKRFLSLILSLVIVIGIITSVPMTVNAASESDLTFELSDYGEFYLVTDCNEEASGEIVIPDTYKGLPVVEIDNYTFSGCNFITTIKLGKNIGYCSEAAFEDCENLTNITVSAGNENFSSVDGVLFNEDKSGLVRFPEGKQGSYIIPEGVRFIDNRAFMECGKLTDITIANSVQGVGECAFSHSGITSLVVPDTVIYIWNDAFSYCKNLKSIKLGNGITSITSRSFSGCESLTDVVFGENITSIENGAFSDCSSLTSIQIPNTITSIGDSAFSDCTGLTSVDINRNITNIGEDAFSYCDNLSAINVDSNNTVYASVDGLLYNKDKTILIYCPTGKPGQVEFCDTVTDISAYAFAYCDKITEVIIGKNVVNIGEYAFTSCSNISSVIIPDSVVSIGADAFSWCDALKSVAIGKGVTEIGENAFHLATKLQSFDVDSENTAYCSKEGVLFDKVNYILIQYPSCKKDVVYNIPEGTLTIANDAFDNCLELLMLRFPDSVTSIGEGALATTDIKYVEIGTGLANVAYHAFPYSDMSHIVYCGSEGDWNKISIDDSNDSIYAAEIHYVANIGDTSYEVIEPTCTDSGEFKYSCNICNSEFIESLSSTRHNRVAIATYEPTCTKWGYTEEQCSICDEIFENYSEDPLGHNFVDGVCSVCGSNGLAFELNENGTEYIVTECDSNVSWDIIIPSTYRGLPVKSIDRGVFSHCKNLTGLTIPDSVMEISADNFVGCYSLKEINIAQETLIDGSTYGPYDRILDDTQYFNDVDNWEDDVLYLGSNLIAAKADIKGIYQIKTGTKTIADNAFALCKSLESVIIPDGVSSIGRKAFCDCILISEIIIPESVTEIEDYAVGYYADNVSLELAYDNKVNLLTKLEVFKIFGVKGTVAENYAKENGFTFIDINHTHTLSSWITDTSATVNAPGSKHKECTECGEVLQTATIAQLKPSTPTLKAIANTASGVKVSWGKVSGVDNYIVYRKTYNATTKKWSGWSRIADDVTSTSYTDKTAKSGTYYRYTVRAENEAGLSGYDSTGLKIKFLSTPKLTSIANATGKVTVKWNKVSGATGYIVYRKTYNASTKTWSGWSRLATTKSNSYNDTKAKSGTYYRYTVRAYSGDYTSYFDTTGLKTKYLATPTLKSVASAKSGVTVKWGKVTGATGYIVYRKTGSGSWKQVAVVEGNSKVSYLDKTAKKGTTYKYTVRAYYGSYRSYFNTKGLTIKDKY